MKEKLNKVKLTDLRELKKLQQKTAKPTRVRNPNGAAATHMHFVDQTTSGENTVSEQVPLEDQKKMLAQDSSIEF